MVKENSQTLIQKKYIHTHINTHMYTYYQKTQPQIEPTWNTEKLIPMMPLCAKRNPLLMNYVSFIQCNEYIAGHSHQTLSIRELPMKFVNP